MFDTMRRPVVTIPRGLVLCIINWLSRFSPPLCMSYALTMINGFIIDELCYTISSRAFIMTPTCTLHHQLAQQAFHTLC